MSNLLRHVTSQPFVASTALAALMHSTWTVSTLFGGLQPEFGWDYVMWLLPGLLLAFSLDIGLLVTATEIRSGEKTRAKYMTFAVLSVSMFFLQSWYMLTHAPSVPLAAGVRDSWIGVAMLLRDAGIWIVPALLPISTTLYTFSSTKQVKVIKPVEKVVVANKTQNGSGAQAHELFCHHCEWSTGEKTTPESAERALKIHVGRRHKTEKYTNGKTKEKVAV